MKDTQIEKKRLTIMQIFNYLQLILKEPPKINNPKANYIETFQARLHNLSMR